MSDETCDGGGAGGAGGLSMPLPGYPDLRVGNFLSGGGLLGISGLPSAGRGQQAWANAQVTGAAAPGAGDQANPVNAPMEGLPGVRAGDFVSGQGLLGIVLRPQGSLLPTKDKAGPLQMANMSVNGVPLTIRQMQSDQTGDPVVGDVDDLRRSLALLSPHLLEGLSNRNVSGTSVPDSADQAYPDDDIADKPPQGWPAGRTGAMWAADISPIRVG